METDIEDGLLPIHYLFNISNSSMGNSSNYSEGELDPNCEQCGFCHYDKHTVYVMGFLATFVVIFGCIANSLNVRVFTHKFMRSSVLNWYYAALSISDLFVLLISFFRDILPRLSDFAGAYSMYSAMSLLTPTTQTIGCMAQTTSVFLTVAMSAHRFIGVCFPFKAHRICTRTNTTSAIVGVILFAIFFNLSRAFEVTTHTYNNCSSADHIVDPWPTPLRLKWHYKTYYLGWAYTFVMYIVPFTLLISLNIKVMLAIRHTSHMHRRMSVKDTNVTKRKEISKEISTSVMLIGVVIVFLVCNTPAFMANMMEVFKLVGNDGVYSKVVDYNNLLIVVNASANCFVYLSFSDKYRALLKHYLSCGCFHDSEPLVDTSAAGS